MISKYVIALATAAALGACADPSVTPVASAPAPRSASSDLAPKAAAPSDSHADGGVPIDAFYTHDVWVVAVPPLAIYALARFDEAPDAAGASFDCERALLEHARMLGGNRLYIDRSAACRGTAYFVRPSQTDKAETDAGAESPLRSGGPYAARTDYHATLRDWIHARWRRPASVSEEALESLCTVVQFSTSETLTIWNVRAQPIHSSGNAAFDASVHDALESAIDAHSAIPEPPAGEEGRGYRRAQIRFAFSVGSTAQCR